MSGATRRMYWSWITFPQPIHTDTRPPVDTTLVRLGQAPSGVPAEVEDEEMVLYYGMYVYVCI